MLRLAKRVSRFFTRRPFDPPGPAPTGDSPATPFDHFPEKDLNKVRNLSRKQLPFLVGGVVLVTATSLYLQSHHESNKEKPSEAQPSDFQSSRVETPEAVQAPPQEPPAAPQTHPDSTTSSDPNAAALKLLFEKTQEFVEKIAPKSVDMRRVESLEGLRTALSEGKEGVVVAAIPIFFREQSILDTVQFLEAFGSHSGIPLRVFWKVVGRKEDFASLTEATQVPFLSPDDSFMTLAVFNPNLQKFVGLRLEELRRSAEVLAKSFRPPTPVRSADDWTQATHGLSRDQLLFVICGKNTPNSSLISQMLFDSKKVSLSRSLPLVLDSDNALLPCDPNKLTVLWKNPAGDGESVSVLDRKLQKIEVSASEGDSPKTLAAKLAQELDQATVFRNPWVESPPKRYRVELEVDKNRVGKAEISRLGRLVREVKKELGDTSREFDFVLKGKTSQVSGSVSEVTAVDTQRLVEQNQLFFENQDREKAERALEKDPTALFHFGSEFRLSGSSLDKEGLVAFCRSLESGEAQPHFKSQKAPLTTYYSRKVVASEFDQRVLESPYNQLIFYYSHHCGSCKKFLPMFEEMALENLRHPQHKLTFNRIDNEHNQVASQEVLLSTPKIVLFRTDSRGSPIEYRSDKLNSSLLRGFINASLDFSLLSDWSLVEKAATLHADTIQSGFFKGLISPN